MSEDRGPIATFLEFELLNRGICMSSNYSEISKSNSSFVDGWLAYAVFRFTLGINIFIHGASRVFAVGAKEFAIKTSSEFAGTALPHGLLYASYFSRLGRAVHEPLHTQEGVPTLG
jgi:hypothetical protein